MDQSDKGFNGEDGSLDKLVASAATENMLDTIVHEVKVIQAQGTTIFSNFINKAGKWSQAELLPSEEISRVGTYGRWRLLAIFVASIRQVVRRQRFQEESYEKDFFMVECGVYGG
ncbi:hypothetical protein Tco_0044762 [Tanacetum coccineum]